MHDPEQNRSLSDHRHDDAYVCPICGEAGRRHGEGIHRELNLCSSCGSNSRFRATVVAVLKAIVGQDSDYNLSQMAPQKAIRGIGCSDSEVHARLLADKFDYVNTFYHGEPFLDIENDHSYLEYQPLDFIICNDVLEHAFLPPGEVIPILYQSLRPGGYLILCAPTYKLPKHIEKYPSLAGYEVNKTAKGYQLHVQPKLGRDHVDPQPVFHGGPGSVLELRLISDQGLQRNLRSVGFEVSQLSDSVLKIYGAWWPERLERSDLQVEAIGKPFICRKSC
ncbi:MAG: hypothetical protein VKP63_10970 [Cyanobacteriota bacterium]|nr:hypothetical protein [Cyanobacteriota bacterium]